MRELTAQILTFISIATLCVKANLENCCEKVYLFSSDTIADNQVYVGPLLGIYQYAGQHQNRPYYYKNVDGLYDQNGQLMEKKFFLVFFESEIEIDPNQIGPEHQKKKSGGEWRVTSDRID